MTDHLITVERFRDLHEALLAQGKLESAGIESFLADGNIVRADWLWSNAVGGLRLQVRANDALSARELLHEPAPEAFTEEEVGEVYAQPHCPRCDSIDIRFETLDHFWTYGFWLVTGFPVPIRKQNWKCHACGSEWVEE